jgi:hypothetical protein
VNKILVGKPEGKDHSEDVVIDGKVVLEWILEKQAGRVWTGFMWLRTGASGAL